METGFSILRQIVGKCHVGTSIDIVIKFAINRLKDRQKTFDNMPARHQKLFIAKVKQFHMENQKVFTQWRF